MYKQVVIRVPRAQRDPLRKHLQEQVIGSEVYYPVPLHLQEWVSGLGYASGDLPVSERAAAETLALPIYPELSQSQQAYVVDHIAKFAASAAGAIKQSAA